MKAEEKQRTPVKRLLYCMSVQMDAGTNKGNVMGLVLRYNTSSTITTYSFCNYSCWCLWNLPFTYCMCVLKGSRLNLEVNTASFHNNRTWEQHVHGKQTGAGTFENTMWTYNVRNIKPHLKSGKTPTTINQRKREVKSWLLDFMGCTDDVKRPFQLQQMFSDIFQNQTTGWSLLKSLDEGENISLFLTQWNDRNSIIYAYERKI